MSFQLCPLCSGSGIDPNIRLSNNYVPTCPTCKGKRIIDQHTGLPPGEAKTHRCHRDRSNEDWGAR